MNKTSKKTLQRYRQKIENKYTVYNSLFMNLPYDRVQNIGMLLPLLFQHCKSGLEAGKNPKEIMDSFFVKHTHIDSEEQKIDFFFRVIQYVERQVVLFDSVEEAGFTSVKEAGDHRPLAETIRNITSEDIKKVVVDKLSDFSVRLVFTAHPTQFYPLPVLDIISDLRQAISDDRLEDIDLLLQQLGLTSFINKEKPTPEEEAANIIYYLRNVYYDAISDIYQSLKTSLAEEHHFDNPRLISIGFWPGGDRDGNPFVTAETTMHVADVLRMTLMKCYYNDVKILQRKLTFRRVQDTISMLRAELYKAMFDPSYVMSYRRILTILEQVKSDVKEYYNSLYVNDIDILIDKVKIFRTHFATIDIRQDHRKHKSVVSAILAHHNVIDGSIDEIAEEQLLEIIMDTKLSVNADDYQDDIVKDTIRNIQNLKEIQQKNGNWGCNRYIISNSEDVFSVIFVYALFKWCGYEDADITFDIVPLFETMVGMDASAEVMNKLYSMPVYKDHLAMRSNVQTIMLGFSDGTKDGGYLKANYEIYHTKERLTKLSNDLGIRVIFFDGRGGPPARGGGKTHRFYASQGDTIASNEIQLTIQGQTITSTFGTAGQFAYNVDQMITAGIQKYLVDENKHVMQANHRSILEELSALSYEKYDALKKHPQFVPYLEKMSTLKYYGKANIGSRPGKRGNTKELTLDDLRAISFVGSWSQLKQNVPGYFGIGTAIKQLQDSGKIAEVKALFNEEPFFKALILNSMMSLKKSYFPLTAYMKSVPQFAAFWQILKDEYDLSKRMLLEISGFDTLMEEELISKASISTREQIVLPLLTIQQYALQHLSATDSYKDVYEKIVTRSLYGNINASRNSA